MEDNLIFWEMEDKLIFLMKDNLQFFFKCNVNQQHSTDNLTNKTTKNILAHLKKSTLIGCDTIVN